MSAQLYHMATQPSPVPRLTQIDIDLRLSIYADLIATLLVIGDELEASRKRPCLDTTLQEWQKVGQTLVCDVDPRMREMARAYAVELMDAFLGRQ